MERPTEFLVRLRGGGKTYSAIEWLIMGHKIDAWPQWSRLLVVRDVRLAQWTLKAFPELQAKLHEQGNGGLGKLVITMEEAKRLRGLSREVEIAVDDAEGIIFDSLRIWPSLVTISGTIYDPPSSAEVDEAWSQSVVPTFKSD